MLLLAFLFNVNVFVNVYTLITVIVSFFNNVPLGNNVRKLLKCYPNNGFWAFTWNQQHSSIIYGICLFTCIKSKTTSLLFTLPLGVSLKWIRSTHHCVSPTRYTVLAGNDLWVAVESNKYHRLNTVEKYLTVLKCRWNVNLLCKQMFCYLL